MAMNHYQLCLDVATLEAVSSIHIESDYIADKRLQFIDWSLNNLDSSSLPQHHDSNRNSTASAASEASENARQSDKDGQEH